MKRTEQVDEIARDSFGLSIAGLFSATTAHIPSPSFEQQKQTFFCLIEQLLASGRIKFIAPGVDCYLSAANPSPRLTINDSEAQWNASAKEIVRQLSTQWPQQAHDENDVDLVTYFYSIPGLIWVDDDGTLVAS
ncbi:hypothetical protein [Rhizobium sp. BK377]|jgi:hypothetical protein|uniref:hypothetical protein n=1 Tax=Rhizobium sp. BK377 TaxID=2587058 RepID=UPI0016092CA3|nr:hypothetical protein [Rhizobium sp. BK377]MBB3465234.1 hypothetical protein [Rhizobium sp. BK377]